MTRDGEVAIVIGGTGALGSAIAKRLATEGADIAFTYYQNNEKESALSEEIKALGRRVSASPLKLDDIAAVETCISKFASDMGRIDTLVYAAGPPFDLSFIAQTSPSDWSRVIDADLKGCFNVVHATLPYLRQTQGSIVTVTAAGVHRAIACDIMSLAPKAAITALIKGVALEEGRFGVRANCVAPGYISGGIGQKIMSSLGSDLTEKLIKNVPLRRMGTVEEVADATAYLSSAGASYVTGTTLFVSGGMEL